MKDNFEKLGLNIKDLKKQDMRHLLGLKLKIREDGLNLGLIVVLLSGA